MGVNPHVIDTMKDLREGNNVSGLPSPFISPEGKARGKGGLLTWRIAENLRCNLDEEFVLAWNF